ncbi:MAG: hypothetical protein JXO49_04065 [Deltaproteobacteria bacterium]|nr:hypothetical protein [Candidatus Anaeroferrophillus wilburensis]MBN2888505.1 hypothetical protein [Deltaproteobacteria bacterium]
MPNAAAATIRYLKNRSLQVKLLGIYLIGLTILGCIGYGSFITLEVKNFHGDRQVFTEQGKFFEQLAFNHLKYTVHLRNHLVKVYSEADSRKDVGKEAILNDFINSVIVLNDDNFNFALFDYNGALIATNSHSLKEILADNPVTQNQIYKIIAQTTESGIHGSYIEFAHDDGATAWLFYQLHLL